VNLRNGGSGSFSTLATEDPGLVYTLNYLPAKIQLTIQRVPERSAGLAVLAAGITLRRRRRRSVADRGMKATFTPYRVRGRSTASCRNDIGACVVRDSAKVHFAPESSTGAWPLSSDTQDRMDPKSM
jgi:hypothetical protein